MTARHPALPGFRLSLGLTVLWLVLLVLLPLAGLVVKAASLSPAQILAALATPRALAAFRVSFGTAALAALFDLPEA